MRFVVVTGPSGAGKTFALHSFEDAGFYTVDNLPPRLLPALIAFCQAEGLDEAAVTIDARSGTALGELGDVLASLDQVRLHVEILFLDASDAVLVQRFKETRRPHPRLRTPSDGQMQIGILEAIQEERILLSAARALADRVVDTSALSPTQLRDIVHATYTPDARPGLLVTILSFGFKHGLPIDADLVFDVRFLRNPHYVPTLKALNGHDAEVACYVHEDPLTRPFQEKMVDLVRFALPQYEREGKAYLNIAIGCTGGRHRSVVVSEDLAAVLRRDGFQVAVRHRDIVITEGQSAGTSYALPSVPASEKQDSEVDESKMEASDINKLEVDKLEIDNPDVDKLELDKLKSMESQVVL